MAGWAVGQTDRFGAAVAMSVVSNYVSFHLTSEVWWYDKAILKGEWNDPTSQYPERSPVTHAHRCTTPTLIIQGEDDRCTPLGQAEELFHAIAASGSEVELVTYPREGHVPVERAHALDAIDQNAGLVRPTPLVTPGADAGSLPGPRGRCRGARS